MEHRTYPIRKVLVLAPPMSGIGGVQNYTRALVRGLQTILGDQAVRLCAVPAEPVAQADGTMDLSAATKVRFLASAFIQVFRGRPDLVICAHIGMAPAARLIRKVTGIPFWQCLHGIEVWRALSPSKERALKSAQRYIALTRFSLQATVDQHQLGEVSAVMLPPPLPEGASERPGCVSPAAFEKPVVLTVGRLAASERYKGHDAMLDAWSSVLSKVPEAVYWIVGDGDDRTRLESRADELGIAGSVRFFGALSGRELNRCYDLCAVFAMPACTELDPQAPRGEGFGIVYLEAMARGKPVLGPNTGAPPEFIRSGEDGLLVNPGEPREIAEALVYLLKRPVETRRMVEQARDWVQAEFSFERFCERLRNALRTDL